MFLRHVIVALSALAMLSAGASAEPTPTTGDPFVDDTVATTSEYADQYSSQWLAFATRVGSMITAATDDATANTIDTSDAVYVAAETASVAIQTAIVEGDLPALNAAILDFQSEIDLAATQFQTDTQTEGNEFSAETTLATQVFVTTQREASFAFATDMRSITAQYATDDVAVVGSMAAFLTFLALDTGSSSATFVFDDIATGTFVVVNEATVGSAETSVAAARDFGVEGFTAAGLFRDAQISRVGGEFSNAQGEVAGGLGELMQAGRDTEASHQEVNNALEEKADEIMGMQDEVLEIRTGAFGEASNQQATANDIAAGGIGGIGTAVASTFANGGDTVFGLLTG